MKFHNHVNNMKVRYIIYSLSILLVGSTAFAQKNLSEQVNVVRAYKPILAEAVIINSNPEIKFEQEGKTNPDYHFLSHRIDSNLKLNALAVEKMKNESIAKLYRYYIRMAGGNYRSSYFEAWANNLRSKEWVMSTHYRHRASASSLKNYDNMAFSENTINANAKRIYNKQTVSLALLYDRDVNHYYGYDHSKFELEPRSIRQQYDLFGLQSEVVSNHNNNEQLKYNGRFDIYTLKDFFKASENRFSLNATGNYKEFESKILFDFAKYADTLDQQNNLFGMENLMHLKESGIDINIGFNMYQEFGKTNLFHIYPNVSASYNYTDFDAKVYVGLKGGMRKNSLRNIYTENPFIRDNINIENANEKINLYAGIRGRIDSKNSYQVNFTYLKTDNEMYYLADADTVTRYYVIYDGANASEMQINLNYAHQSNEKLRINGNLEYRIFNTDTLKAAWFKPSTRLALSAEYNIANKFLLNTELYGYSKMKSATITGLEKELEGGIDLNIGIDYRYSKMISVYLNLNNLLNYKRENYLFYPGFGFQAMLGASFRF